jgi:hypothetical protein
LLRTDLLTLNLLAASKIFGLLELPRNMTALLIDAIVVELLGVEVVLFMGAGGVPYGWMCPVAGCALWLDVPCDWKASMLANKS